MKTFIYFVSFILGVFGWLIVTISVLDPMYNQSIFGMLLLIYSKMLEKRDD